MCKRAGLDYFPCSLTKAAAVESIPENDLVTDPKMKISQLDILYKPLGKIKYSFYFNSYNLNFSEKKRKWHFLSNKLNLISEKLQMFSTDITWLTNLDMFFLFILEYSEINQFKTQESY